MGFSPGGEGQVWRRTDRPTSRGFSHADSRVRQIWGVACDLEALVTSDLSHYLLPLGPGQVVTPSPFPCL